MSNPQIRDCALWTPAYVNEKGGLGEGGFGYVMLKLARLLCLLDDKKYLRKACMTKSYFCDWEKETLKEKI